MTPQETIAHYRITSKLGEGGMGAVYRATDTKLNRDVAIKVLPGAFAQDPDRMARFQREAQVLASLNHPNIAAIYGVEDCALVMELVEGETLQGPVPLEQALPLIHQLIDALEYAHEKGIIHRDLKPANIKVTPEGRVKVLDFGLAKAMSEDTTSGSPQNSPTLTMRATMAGMIIGTAAYMAPEQARGHNVDKRADIWAFGVVLYELLTGKQLFEGPTVSDTLAAVLRQEPEWNLVPVEFRRLVKNCLARDAKHRMRDIGDARLLIEEAAPRADGAPIPTPQPPTPNLYRWIAIAIPVLAALTMTFLWWRASRPADRPLVRFSADLGPDAQTGLRTTAVISPDGTRIAFPVRSGSGTLLATQLLNQSKPIVLSGTDNPVDPFFSPDGQWIGFSSSGKLKKISVQGGAPITLCETSQFRGASWSEDGTIIAALGGLHLSRIPEAGGTPEVVAKPEDQGMRTYRYPQVLPGGEMVMVTAAAAASSTVGYDDAEIKVLSLKTRQIKTVQRGGYFGRYLPSGHLIYVHNGTLFGVRFDLSRLETRGMPAPIVEGLAGNSAQAGGQLDVSRNGTLVFLSGKPLDNYTPLAWMDSTGKTSSVGATGMTIRLSPDGKLLALSVDGDLSVYDIQRGALSRLTFSPSANNRFPVWTPDGKHIVYNTNETIWWIRSDGSGQPSELSKDGGVPVSFSPDGKLLAIHKNGGVTNRDIWILPLDRTDPEHPKAGAADLFVKTNGADIEPTFSPDGRWIAYTTGESSVNQVFVRPYPEGLKGGGKWQISTAPGRFPIWARNGKELFFEAMDGHIMVANYTTRGETFIPDKPREWSPTPIFMTSVFQNLDLHPDGKRFVVVPRTEAEKGTGQNLHVTFMLNFFDDLKRRMP